MQRGDLHLTAAAALVPRQAAGAHGVEDLHADARAPLELTPRGIGLGEEHAGVDRENPGVGHELGEHVDEDGLLLLEGAGQGEARVVVGHRLGDDLLGAERLDVGDYTAHSPSPLTTW